MRIIKAGEAEITLTCGDELKVREWAQIQPVLTKHTPGVNDFEILGDVLVALAENKETAKAAYDEMNIEQFQEFSAELSKLLDQQKKTKQ